MNTQNFASRALLIAVVAALLAYFGLQAFSYLNDPLTTAIAYSYDGEESFEVSGYVARDETPLSGAGGLLRLRRSEGERVSAGGTVALTYANETALEQQNELEDLKSRIEQLEYLLNGAVEAEAARKLDQSIQEELTALHSLIASGRLDGLEETGSTLRSLVLRRDYASSEADLEETLETLRARESSLRAQSESAVQRITAPEAGLYSAVSDGFESVLTPDALSELTPSKLNHLTADENAVSPVGKLVRGDAWYYCASMTTAEIRTLRESRTLSLRFSRSIDRLLPVTLYAVGPEENGRSVVTLMGKTYLSELTVLRQQTAEVVYRSVSGIRVPTEALRSRPAETDPEHTGTENPREETGVYCIVGTEACFKPVELLYSGDGYAVVRGISTDERTRLRNGDEVILRARDLHDGKILSEL